MLSNSQSRWPVAGATFALWVLAAASAAYWGLKLAPGSSGSLGMAAATPQAATADPAAVARLLGASAPASTASLAPSLSSRFLMVGVVAGRSHDGAALIAVDGKPAKPFRVGSTVAEGMVLQSVQGRRAVLATGTDGPPILTLEMPPIKR